MVSFNTVAVGRPRDGDLRVGYILPTMDAELQVEFQRVAQDVGAAAIVIRSCGFPVKMAGRLDHEGWTSENQAPAE
jgi:hypothetical protein